MSDVKWVPDAASKARVAADLARIDNLHALHPECALCGQRAVVLDRYGLCRKVSVPHEEWRAEMRAHEKASVR